MEYALKQLLLTDTSIANLVGTRINWVKSQQGAASPRIVLYRVSGVRDMHMQGPSGLVSSRVQGDCLGLTYDSAKSVARAVEARLSGFKGTRGAVRFDGCFLDNERDDDSYSDTPDKLFRTSLDFIIWHKEA